MIRYLNTDLDLVSAEDLKPLVSKFEAEGLLTLHLGQGDDGRYHASFETGEGYETPEATLIAMLDIIESLLPAERAIWSAAAARIFNIGYDCGKEPWGFSSRLSNAVLRRIGAAEAVLQITLYPPDTRRQVSEG